MLSNNSGQYSVLLTTVETTDQAKKLATELVEEKLAACVTQVSGATSTYIWEGKLEESREVLLIIKTRKSLLAKIEDHFEKHHPYDVPELISMPLVNGSEKYLHFLRDATEG